MKSMRSSYKENNYGSVLESLIYGLKPKKVVEFGVLDGYSTLHIAFALRFNATLGHSSVFHAWDLWGNYRFNHGNREEVYQMLIDKGLDKFVILGTGDCIGDVVHKQYTNNSIDFMHVDISNDGDKLLKVLDIWSDKIRSGGIIAFEGGTSERDNVEWMKKYNKRPIREVLNMDYLSHWRYTVLTPFPSMTLFFKNDVREQISEDKEFKLNESN